MTAAECKGHPAGPYDKMGETTFCDGSCNLTKFETDLETALELDLAVFSETKQVKARNAELAEQNLTLRRCNRNQEKQLAAARRRIHELLVELDGGRS